MILEMDKVKFTGIDGTPQCLFRQKGVDPKSAFTIIVTPTGVRFKGNMIGELEGQSDLQSLAKLIDEVWRERMKMRGWKPDPNIEQHEAQ